MRRDLRTAPRIDFALLSDAADDCDAVDLLLLMIERRRLEQFVQPIAVTLILASA